MRRGSTCHRRWWLGWRHCAGPIDESRKTWFAYIDAKGESTERTVRPLGLFFWGATWSLSAWCELRDDYRDFRLDRIEGLTVCEERFAPEAGKTLEEFFRRMDEDHRWEQH